MTKACVIGFPVKHSRSPLIHGHWINQFGIDGTYEQVEIMPTDLASFLENLPQSGYVGCNITLPHKEVACTLIPRCDDRAKRAGSVNTVFIRDKLVHATTTDGQGFVKNVKWRVPGFQFSGKSVMILGAGGSSRAIIDELLRCGVAKVILANRTLAKAQTIASAFDEQIHPVALSELKTHLPMTDLLINTTSAGIANQDQLEVPFADLRPTALVTDINYVPLVTPFLRQALQYGFPIVPGLGMLLHQAVRGFELWFGRTPHVTDELYDLVARDIDSEYRP